VSEIPGFKLGTTSYLPNVSTIPYMDMRTAAFSPLERCHSRRAP
jgi:hypothetical protein